MRLLQRILLRRLRPLRLDDQLPMARRYYSDRCAESSEEFDPDRGGYPELDDHYRKRVEAALRFGREG